MVIGGHFGGGDHFDGGDHFGGGTGPQRFFALNDFSLYFVFLAYQTALPH